jgi:hypothetical protein
MPAYENTSVPVSRSQEGVRTLLQKHGASQFTFGEATVAGKVWVGVEFALNDRSVRMRVPLGKPDDDALASKARRSRTKTLGEIRAEANEQEARRVWRVLHWSLKARLEAVENGLETFEEAFLAHLVTEDGVTVYEALALTGRVDLGEARLALPPGTER